jgi:hypothetical protein
LTLEGVDVVDVVEVVPFDGAPLPAAVAVGVTATATAAGVPRDDVTLVVVLAFRP